MISHHLLKNLRTMLFSTTSRSRTTIHYGAPLLDGEEGRALRAVLNMMSLKQKGNTQKQLSSGGRERNENKESGT